MVMNGGAIAWRSKLQNTVSLSTMEAETVAGVEAVKELINLRLLLKEIGFPEKLANTLYEDNASAIHIIQGNEGGKKSKYFQVKVKWLAEKYEEGVFQYAKVPSKDNLADHFTKALPLISFQRFRTWMGVTSSNELHRLKSSDTRSMYTRVNTETVGAYDRKKTTETRLKKGFQEFFKRVDEMIIRRAKARGIKLKPEMLWLGMKSLRNSSAGLKK